MESCGLIYVSSDYESFLMRCSYCSTDDFKLSKWQEFVLHIRTLHKNDPNSEAELDLDDLKTESVEQVTLEDIREEIEDSDANANDDDGDNDDAGSRPSSSLNSNDSEYMETDSEENSEAESDTATQAAENEEGSTQVSPSYKFNPSFFRRDPRTLKFIELYKAQPCLWNSRHSQYREPSTCKAAYQQLIKELETKFGVILTEHSLKTAIKRIHLQYKTVEKRVACGNQKKNSLAFSHFLATGFLKACKDKQDGYPEEKIELDFSSKNKLTTDLIEQYSNFPQLYDPNHKDFHNMESRKQAYESLAAEISLSHSEEFDSDDIYSAIQKLRQWFYKSDKLAINSGGHGSEQFYLEVCRFLPPKVYKQTLVCEICSQRMSSEKVLQSHLYKVHNIGELPFKCTLCERSFMVRGALLIHKQRVHVGKTHKCTHCERSFAVVADLRLHIRTHTGLKPFICELCGKAFRLRSQLKNHDTAIHQKLRAFKCTMCTKDFVKKVDLADHIKGHLNIRDKICSTCGKGFTSCHSLIRHRQIHAEVKKFVCKLCDSRFSQFVGLNSHMKRTHNIVRSKTTE